MHVNIHFMYFKKHNIMNEYLEIKFRNVQARQVSQQLIIPAALAEDLDSLPSTPHGSSQPSLAPVPEDLCSFRVYTGTAHMWCSDILVGKIFLIHKIKINLFKKYSQRAKFKFTIKSRECPKQLQRYYYGNFKVK